MLDTTELDLELLTDAGDSAALVVKELGREPGVHSDINLWIGVSHAKDGVGTTYYRPYFVCAILSEARDNTEKIISTRRVTFKDPDSSTLGYLKAQAALDAALGLIVPEGMRAVWRVTTLNTRFSRLEVTF